MPGSGVKFARLVAGKCHCRLAVRSVYRQPEKHLAQQKNSSLPSQFGNRDPHSTPDAPIILPILSGYSSTGRLRRCIHSRICRRICLLDREIARLRSQSILHRTRRADTEPGVLPLHALVGRLVGLDRARSLQQVLTTRRWISAPLFDAMLPFELF